MPALEEAEGALEGLRSLRAEIVDAFLSKVRTSALNPTHNAFGRVVWYQDWRMLLKYGDSCVLDRSLCVSEAEFHTDVGQVAASC